VFFETLPVTVEVVTVCFSFSSATPDGKRGDRDSIEILESVVATPTTIRTQGFVMSGTSSIFSEWNRPVFFNGSLLRVFAFNSECNPEPCSGIVALWVN